MKKIKISKEAVDQIKKWIHAKSLRSYGLRVPDLDKYLDSIIKEKP